MLDGKTGGTRWVPDIRSDEIETFTEENAGTTATYKAINFPPIINKVLDKLAFYRTHAVAVWYNKLAGKTVKDKFDEVDTELTTLSNKTNFHPVAFNIAVSSAPTEITYLRSNLTIPANSFFSVTAIAYFNNSQPSFIGISHNEDRYNEIVSSRVGYHMASTTFSGYTEESKTLYFWGQWSAATDNSAQVRGFYVTQP